MVSVLHHCYRGDRSLQNGSDHVVVAGYSGFYEECDDKPLFPLCSLNIWVVSLGADIG